MPDVKYGIPAGPAWLLYIARSAWVSFRAGAVYDWVQTRQCQVLPMRRYLGVREAARQLGNRTIIKSTPLHIQRSLGATGMTSSRVSQHIPVSRNIQLQFSQL